MTLQKPFGPNPHSIGLYYYCRGLWVEQVPQPCPDGSDVMVTGVIAFGHDDGYP
jgi:hypothetical protein